MFKKIYFTALISLIIVSGLGASVYKGHALFQKKCLSCHGKALEFVIDKDSDEWTKIMDEKGKELLVIHLKALDPVNPDHLKSLKYFKGKRFPKNARHFKDFLLEYASDTGNIPACD